MFAGRQYPGYISVSYTHLDVYKRQALFPADMLYFIFQNTDVKSIELILNVFGIGSGFFIFLFPSALTKCVPCPFI